MAELLLSKCLDVLFDQLLSSDLLKFARREGIQVELYKWRKTMTIIQRVLDDAEEQQQTEKAVKDWLDALKDLAYDVEDLLDEFATEALHERKLMAGESQASASIIVQKTDASCCNFRLLSKKWMYKYPKLRPTFAEIMAALKPLQKLITSSQVHRQWPSEGSTITNCRRSRLEEQTIPSYSLSLDCKNMGEVLDCLGLV